MSLGLDKIEIPDFLKAGYKPKVLEPLSKREKQVLQEVVKGFTNPRIGLELNIAEKTVQNHMRTILRKLGVKNRTAAAVEYLKFYDKSDTT